MYHARVNVHSYVPLGSAHPTVSSLHHTAAKGSCFELFQSSANIRIIDYT